MLRKLGMVVDFSVVYYKLTFNYPLALSSPPYVAKIGAGLFWTFQDNLSCFEAELWFNVSKPCYDSNLTVSIVIKKYLENNFNNFLKLNLFVF